MTRLEANGLPKILMGRIVKDGIKSKAKAIRIMQELTKYCISTSFEISGVKGDYKIISRECIATYSQYAN